MSLPFTLDLQRALTEARRARNAILNTRNLAEPEEYKASVDAINRTIEVLTERLYTRQRRADLRPGVCL